MPKAAAADKNAAAAHGCAGPAGGQARQIRRDGYGRVNMLVPKRESTRNDFYAITLGPLLVIARIGRHNIDIMSLDVAAAHRSRANN